MTEEKETPVTAKPEGVSKYEQNMSAAPFYGLSKIEFEEQYKNFEETMKEMEKNKEIPWGDFFKNALALESELKMGAVVVVETNKYRFICDNKPGYEAKKFKSGIEWATEFLTWQQVIDRLKLWKDTKFDPNLIVEPDRICINRNFRHVHIFKHKKGYIFCNQFDVCYQADIMKSSILLAK